MDKQIQSAVRAFAAEFGEDRIAAVTLTMKQYILPIALDPIIAQNNLSHFLDRLNQKVYGNAAKRCGKKLEVFASLENSVKDRLHYHLAIKIPDHVDAVEFDKTIRSCWSKTKWSDQQVYIRDHADFGWIKYITKFTTKDCEVDWVNSHRRLVEI